VRLAQEIKARNNGTHRQFQNCSNEGNHLNRITPSKHCSGHFNRGLLNIAFQIPNIAAEQLTVCKINCDADPISSDTFK